MSDRKISLIVSVDGVLLYKSISVQFWPIICCFHNLSSFIVGIYCGNRKWSNVKEFVLEFFTKYRNLQNDDGEFRGVKVDIEIFSFVCDPRATHLLMSIKSHNGY